MKKSVKKFLSVFMAVVMIALSGVTSFAMDETEWATVFESADAKAGLTVFVGSDESERNFTWYTEKENREDELLQTLENLINVINFNS
mgnify:CR=1 FL=1